MSSKRVVFLVIAFIALIFFNYLGGLGMYESVSIGLLVFCLFDFLDNLGSKIVVLDIAIILAVFTWLVMPVIFYQYYTREDHLARIFRLYMPISADDYFSFALPGTVTMIIGMKLSLAKLQINTDRRGYRQKLENYFKGKDNIGFILIGISLVSGVLYHVVPSSLNRPVNLLEHLSYVGVFYIFFSQNKNKNKILLGVLGVLTLNSVSTGLFGELVFLVALFYILVAIYLKKISFPVKLTICFVGLMTIFVIQNVKKGYREKIWHSSGNGGDASYFGQLISESVLHPSTMLQKDKLFSTAVRMNQGWLIAETMARVPSKFDYAYGETIGTSVLAAFIPRFIWPDKPEAGGRANLLRFWGFYLVGFSENIGPIGEAYANFGRFGGIVFMFFYGLFFNGILTYLLKRSEIQPSILCWIPFLFFYAVVVETDILTTVGSIVTSLMFMIIFSRLFKYAFNIKL